MFRNRCICSMLSSATQTVQIPGWVKQSSNQDTRDFPAPGVNARAPVLFISKIKGKNSGTVFTRAQLLDRSCSCISNLHFLWIAGDQSLNSVSLASYKNSSYKNEKTRICILQWCAKYEVICFPIWIVRNNSLKDFRPQIKKKIIFKVSFYFIYEDPNYCIQVPQY